MCRVGAGGVPAWRGLAVKKLSRPAAFNAWNSTTPRLLQTVVTQSGNPIVRNIKRFLPHPKHQTEVTCDQL
jgi:hypothetical protein